jgi:hypothetical protein
VEVDPAQQQLLGVRRRQLLELRLIEAELQQLGVQRDIDFGQQALLDDLPQQTEHEVQNAVAQIFGANADQLTLKEKFDKT